MGGSPDLVIFNIQIHIHIYTNHHHVIMSKHRSALGAWKLLLFKLLLVQFFFEAKFITSYHIISIFAEIKVNKKIQSGKKSHLIPLCSKDTLN